jgi:hypothetical protein
VQIEQWTQRLLLKCCGQFLMRLAKAADIITAVGQAKPLILKAGSPEISAVSVLAPKRH